MLGLRAGAERRQHLAGAAPLLLVLTLPGCFMDGYEVLRDVSGDSAAAEDAEQPLDGSPPDSQGDTDPPEVDAAEEAGRSPDEDGGTTIAVDAGTDAGGDANVDGSLPIRDAGGMDASQLDSGALDAAQGDSEASVDASANTDAGCLRQRRELRDRLRGRRQLHHQLSQRHDVLHQLRRCNDLPGNLSGGLHLHRARPHRRRRSAHVRGRCKVQHVLRDRH
jgi:hypothetical protein